MHNPQEIIDDLNRSIEGVSEKDLRFFPNEVLKTQIEEMSSHADKCDICNRKLSGTKEIFPMIKAAIAQPGHERKEVDRYLNSVSDHLKTEHGVRSAHHYASKFAMWSMIGSIVVASLVLFLMGVEKMLFLVVSIGVIAFVLGYVAGDLKDRRHEKDNPTVDK
ncbi:hypothetical protein K5X82_14765 [Halosquirtibacter xylanolyticus]|uniref:hypothetical protein n=1 Tax=Halosquirtibacter xylanolyticus TaxID=3374599 RepID=UPI0037488DBE|nr:hypothetical protein K5X82_14765 [Prolixibacteraceae bacterium]